MHHEASVVPLGSAKAQGALARLAALRNGSKGAGLMDLSDDEDAVYDVVEEDEYADLVAKRRETAGKKTQIQL